MWKWLTVILLALSMAEAAADELFIDVSAADQAWLIDENFDYYHDAVFNSVRGKVRIAKLNHALMDQDGAKLTVTFFDRTPSIPVESLGTQGNTKRSAFGSWSGKILPESSVRRVLNTSSGKLENQLRLDILLQYVDEESGEYRNGPGWFNVKKMARRSLSQAQAMDGGIDGYIGPVSADTNFFYRVVVKDLVYISAGDDSWTKITVRSLPNNPEFVLISEPDQSKNFEIFDSVPDRKLQKKIDDYKQEHKKYKDKVREERVSNSGGSSSGDVQ